MTREPYQKDWGWELPASLGSDSYYLCMSGNSDESDANRYEGEWRIIVEKKRGIGQRLSGKGEIAANDDLVQMIKEILQAEPGIREVHRKEVE